MFRVKVFQEGVRGFAEDVVAKSQFTIGRHQDNDLILRHDRVSRFHARVFLRGGFALVEDLGSTNGTSIAGRAIVKPTHLLYADRIEIAVFSLEVEEIEDREVTCYGIGSETRHSSSHQDPHKAWSPDDDYRETSYPRGRAPTRLWFEVLKVDRKSSFEQVKQAYRTLVAQYHPDKVAQLGPEIRVVAENMTRELNAAWEEFQRLQQR